jgi:hypothetical protein
MGLEKTIHVQLRHPAHSYSCGKKSERVRWPTPVAGTSEIKYSKKKILFGRNGGDRTIGRPRSRRLDGFIINLTLILLTWKIW